MTAIAIIGGSAIVIILAILALKLLDYYMFRNESPEMQAEQSRLFQQRLLNPQFDELEQHYRCRIPDSLKSLYAATGIVSGPELDLEDESHINEPLYHHIAFFYPMDSETLKHTFFDSLQYLPLADDGCGNSYIIDPRQNDPAVLFYDHDTSECLEVYRGLSAFITQIRSQAGPQHRSRPSSDQ